MAEPKTMRVIVARVIHGEGKAGEWSPVGYMESIEEADAALNQLLEAERKQLQAGEASGEREYDVWTVPDVWSLLAPSES